MREKATLQAGEDLKGVEGSLLQEKGFVSSSLPARVGKVCVQWRKIPSGWGLEAGSGTELCWQEQGSSHVL